MFRRAVFHNCQLFANLFFLHGFVSFASDDLLKQEAGQKTDFESWIDRGIADLAQLKAELLAQNRAQHNGWKVPISVWYMKIILNYDNKMEFSKHGKHFFTEAKASKVLNLDLFFLYRFYWQIMKRIC